MRLPHRLSPVPAVLCLAIALTLPGAVPAAGAPCSDLDIVVSAFASRGAAVYMIPADRLQLVARDAEDLTGGRYPGVTRGFLVQGKDGFVLGFEIGRCLIDPIRLPAPPRYTAEIAAA